MPTLHDDDRKPAEPSATDAPATPRATDAAAPMLGRVLSRYRLAEELGRGGMAIVYRGVDTDLGREVAVKVLHPHLAELPESRARLEREAQAVAKLKHDNILAIYDYSGPEQAERFLVTELIRGETLTRLVEKSPIELPEIAEMIVAEVTAALAHAHDAGVIHRDVKPENVMVRDDGLVKLTDFGIAQIIDKERLTVTGQLLGSPAYMSPELVEGGRVDQRTDVFAVGVLLYQLASGRLPFQGRNPHEMLKRIAEARFTPLGQVQPLASQRLGRIVGKALERLPEARYPAASALRADLLADLADVGVEDVRVELAGYFAARRAGTVEEWLVAFRTKATRALVANGRKRLAEGRRAAALAAWTRALHLAPERAAEQAELHALIDSLTTQQRRWRLLAVASAGVLALGSTGVLIALHPWRAGAHSPDGGVGPVAADDVLEIAPGGQPAGMVRHPASPASPVARAHLRFGSGAGSLAMRRPPLVPVAATAPTPPATRDVQVHTFPKNVAIYVDGAPAGEYSGAPLTVAAGPHELRFSNPSCCADATAHLGPDDRQTPLVRLAWKSARLVVATQPLGADIAYTVGASRSPALGRGGQELGIRVPPESEGHVPVHLTVSAAGYAPRDLTVDVPAGQTVERAVDLGEAQPR